MKAEATGTIRKTLRPIMNSSEPKLSSVSSAATGPTKGISIGSSGTSHWIAPRNSP